eukprot:UN22586
MSRLKNSSQPHSWRPMYNSFAKRMQLMFKKIQRQECEFHHPFLLCQRHFYIPLIIFFITPNNSHYYTIAFPPISMFFSLPLFEKHAKPRDG